MSLSSKVVGAVASVLGRAIQPSDFETPFMELNMASMEFTRAAQKKSLVDHVFIDCLHHHV